MVNQQTAESAVIKRVQDLISPIVSDLKLDLYDLEFNGGMLRVTIDTRPGSAGGVTLDQVALVTRLVSRDLDHHDPIPGHYTLEVSSPGLERTLRTAAHYQREIGKTLQIRLRAVVNGERRLQGVLISADESAATIQLADKAMSERVIPYDQVDRARTVFQWGPVDKPGKGPAKKSTVKDSRLAHGDKLAPGPSDELDDPIEHEGATA
jgi:ribosome maturation factor RimP